MKKVLEMIAVVVVVMCLISVSVLVSRKPGSDVRAAPGGVEDEAPSMMIIGGGP